METFCQDKLFIILNLYFFSFILKLNFEVLSSFRMYVSMKICIIDKLKI